MIANADGLTLPAICSHLDPVAPGKAFEIAAPSATALPYIIVQMQSDFTSKNRVGTPGATALVTIRAYAKTLPAARALRNAAHARMMTLALDGVQVTHERTVSPVYDGVAYGAIEIYRITVK